MNAVVSVVLFDQDLDQKIDLGWPGLAWVKPWAGPGQALGWAKVQALGWALGKWAPLQPRCRGVRGDLILTQGQIRRAHMIPVRGP